MKNITIVHNHFIQDALRHLRDKKTEMEEFRYYSDRLCFVLMSNILSTSDVATVHVHTPLVKTQVERIMDHFVIVIILRAGVAMLHPALQLLPDAKIGFAGIYRDEKTALPQEYYWKMPRILSKSTILITDPMLATGGSVLHVLRKLKKHKSIEIRVISIVAAPEGVKAIHEEFPNVKIFVASLDSRLNSRKFIVPGLGDYGDRYFGTV